ncbi:hypothetical protein H0E87_031099 [Populus deltoides]|uniref:Uncharacterized protein n=1 Tax=Populus deltoides TaxID=3696 RepID=A0A8T2WKZ1_POPDE|nr:hypothetical protein H0E87_031099 [Populus deltoides]
MGCLDSQFTHALHSAKVINLPSYSAQILYVNAKQNRERKTYCEQAAVGGEVEEDDRLLAHEGRPCSLFTVEPGLPLSLLVSGAIADKTENGGPLAGRYFSFVSRVAGREGWLLLILLLRLRKGVAFIGSITAAEEGYGCGGGYNWASDSTRFWLLLVLAMVQQSGPESRRKKDERLLLCREREGRVCG